MLRRPGQAFEAATCISYFWGVFISSVRWATAWRTWLSIGQQATRPNLNEESAPTQAFLTSLAHIFPLLFPHVSATFTPADLAALNGVLRATLALPVAADSELGFLLTAAEDSLLPLHALHIVHVQSVLQDVLWVLC